MRVTWRTRGGALAEEGAAGEESGEGEEEGQGEVAGGWGAGAAAP